MAKRKKGLRKDLKEEVQNNLGILYMPLTKKQIKCMEGSTQCIECLKKCSEGISTKWAQPTTAAGKIKKSIGYYHISDCGCAFKCAKSKDIKNCNEMKGGSKKRSKRRSKK